MQELKLEILKKIEKVENKVDDITKVNHNQNIILNKLEIMFEKQQEILEEHQRRSLASERRIEIMENKSTKNAGFIQGAAWIVGGLATLISVYSILVKVNII